MNAPVIIVTMPEFNDDVMDLYFSRGEEFCCEICSEWKMAGMADEDLVIECIDCFVSEIDKGFYRILDVKA